MVLSSRLLENLCDGGEQRGVAAVRAILGDRFGILPDYPLQTEGFFVKDSFEIPCLKCTALLPGGLFVDIEEEVRFPMPSLTDGTYYFCVAPDSEATVEYELNGTAMVRPAYTYSIRSAEELDKAGVLPVVRLRVTDGACSIDDAYIPPFLLAGGDGRISEYCSEVVSSVERIIAHDNFSDGEGRNTLEHLRLMLLNVGASDTVKDMMQLFMGVVSASNHFIFKPQGAVEEMPAVSCYDIQNWMTWLKTYLEKALELLDNVEPVKDGLDVDELKRQIEEDLFEKLSVSLSERLTQVLHETIIADTEKYIDEKLSDYTDGTFQRQVRDEISGELGPRLRTELYDSLYRALYDALYVAPPKEDDSFTPLI